MLAEIGRAHGRSAAQVVLRWVLHHGVAVVTQLAHPAHIAANFANTDFALTGDEIRCIDTLATRKLRLIRNDVIACAPDWD